MGGGARGGEEGKTRHTKRNRKGKTMVKKVRKERRREGWSLGKMEKCNFLVFVVIRNFGGGCGFGKHQEQGRQMDGDQWKKETARNGWYQKEDRERTQELAGTKNRKEML